MEEEYYAQRLYQRIEAALGSNVYSFTELVRQCAGAYPTTVATHMRDHPSLPLLRQRDTARIQALPAMIPQGITTQIENNPALASWYFSTETCARIEHMRSWDGMRLAFLGAPRLYEWFRARRVGGYRALLDADDALIQDTSGAAARSGDMAYHYDVADDPGQLGQPPFDAVFLDPPWYADEYPLWLARARQLAPQGTLLLALFPDLTRPSATGERGRIIGALQMQFCAVQMLSGFLHYDTPSFEQGQLHMAGFGNMGPWRSADLVVASGPRAGHVASAAPQQRVRWQEARVGDLRFFIAHRPSLAAQGERLLYQLGESLVLSSPSRRSPLFQQANVLTSRGHGLATSSPARLTTAIDALGASAPSTREATLAHLGVDGESAEILREILMIEIPYAMAHQR
ncbi:hypothetical protein F8S13_00260 [Chloroflexia bacterium SDU3-3]|nr:hypothetical protein F8S13_00260 [Chloroflexia bacterium SDU3-3]